MAFLDKKQIANPGALILVVIIGVFLRFWRMGDMLIFADEIHTLQVAITHDFLWILTHFHTSDACIPLTVYTRMLIKTIGLTEWLFRLPSAVCGSMLIVLIGYITHKCLSAAESLLVTGVFALSPYLIYLSREARPYEIISLLYLFSVLLIFLWAQKPCFSYLIGSAISSAMAVYFHPVVAPSLCILWAYPMVMIPVKRLPKRVWGQYALAVVVLVVIGLILFIPPLKSLLGGIGEKSVKGKAGLQTVTSAMMLFGGIPIRIPLGIWIGLLCVGGYRLIRQYKSETICCIAMIVFQIGILFKFQPELMEVPCVWIRYVAHLHVFIFIFLASGISLILEKIFKYQWFPDAFLSMVIIGLSLFFIYHVDVDHYNFFKRYNEHPMIQFLEADFKNPVLRDQIETVMSPFYLSDALLGTKAKIIEAPMLVTFPLYEIYRKFHGKDIYTGALGDGFAQKLFIGNNTAGQGLCLKTVIDLNQNQNIVKNKVRYLIVHKKIKEEMKKVYDVLKVQPWTGPQLNGMQHLFSDWILSVTFGTTDLKFQNKAMFPVVYEDRFIVVYNVNANKSIYHN